MADEKEHTTVVTNSGGGAGWFIVGGVVVAALILGYVFLGGSLPGGQDDADISITIDTPIGD